MSRSKRNQLQLKTIRNHIAKIVDGDLLLSVLGVSFKRKGNELIANCPSKDHKDMHASWSYNTNKATLKTPNEKQRKFNKHNCFSCGFKGGVIELVQEVLDKDLDDAIDFILDLFKKNKIEEDTLYELVLQDKLSIYEEEKQESKKIRLPKQFELITNRNNPYYRYLKNRGLKDKVIVHYKLGFCDNYKSKKGELNYSYRIIVPIEFENELYTFFARNNDEIRKVDKKWRGLYPSGILVSRIYWPYDEIDYSLGYIIIVEGQFDALRLISEGYRNVLCGFGNKITDEQAELIIKIRDKMIEQCGEFELILMPDGDGELKLVFKNGELDTFNSKATKGKLMILTAIKKVKGVYTTIVTLPDGKDPGELNKNEAEVYIGKRKSVFQFNKMKTSIDYNINK